MSETDAMSLRMSLPLCDAKSSLAAAREVLAGPSEATTNGFSRRDFLIAAGFTFAGAFLSGCQRAPVEEAIPNLEQSEEIVSARPRYYASTCGACSAGCGMLVKTRDGRPIKLGGDPDHPLSKGGLCAAGQASLLGLYDSLRLQQPLKLGKVATWAEIDRGIGAELETIRSQHGAVRILAGTISSPTTRRLIRRFLGAFAEARLTVYDPVSYSALLDAHQKTYGVRLLPRYHLDRADVVVAFDADFLGTWVAPVEYTAGYRAKRLLSADPPRLSHHTQVESRLSLSGSKADERICVTPEEMRALICYLASDLARQAGVSQGASAMTASLPDSLAQACDRLSRRLWHARGHSLVLCGSQETPTQVLCTFINHILNSNGSTLELEQPSYQVEGSDQDLNRLLEEVTEGKVAALLMLDCNPVYDLPNGDTLAQALKKMPLVVCCGERLDESARIARYVCPHPHYLESWDDAEPVNGIVSLRQPTFPKLGNTRQISESLAAWVREPKSAYELLRQSWKDNVFPRQTRERSFQGFWDRAVHDGHVEAAPAKVGVMPFQMGPVQAAFQTFAVVSLGGDFGQNGHESSSSKDPGLFSLILYPKVGMLNGSHGYNAWLQELPDPITKVTWGNYASLSPLAAARLGVDDGDVVRLSARDHGGNESSLELPVFVQRGQHDRVVAVALGYGTLVSARFAGIGPQWLEARPIVGDDGLVGQCAAPLLTWDGGALRYLRYDVKVTRTDKKQFLASTQSHHDLSVPKHLAPPGLECRPNIQQTTLSALADPAHGQEPQANGQASLWPEDHSFPRHHWGMVIDLNACTGCSACVIACQAENNVPVVGKDEVYRHREMHWLRIDRYYSETDSGLEISHQPMLCQHCGHAPCETVCPVLATVHSEEGLNEQVYNRCVGTRYCANNCPFKVRRFNWFAYAHEDSLQNLALNPDVTVRSRGVMEKCTFCVQRIQEAKIEARRRGEFVLDGEVQTACQQSCPARAISFGDLNDPASRVAKLRKDPRHYQLLAELNIKPSVGYLKVVRNRPASDGRQEHG
jgi:molybdopterin-containing oxidoreductase family iron-sulfur binding subunit